MGTTCQGCQKPIIHSESAAQHGRCDLNHKMAASAALYFLGGGAYSRNRRFRWASDSFSPRGRGHPVV